ncbi:MAG TPA: hypothetical protein VMG62_01090 [Solirubrobacteraceae bacterium]|nr:hypothetical protein [Solirubrobacteraceae bacterium]
MRRRVQGRITYANVVATLALVLAMSGGALAANHYLINSTRQINPKVLKKLRGARGKTGARGLAGISIQGPTGPQGPKGERGGEGPHGTNGTNAYEALPAGRSVSGEYAASSEDAAKEGALKEAITFPMLVAGGIGDEAGHEHVIYVPHGATKEHCSGPGHADRGYLCIYSSESSGVANPTMSNPETSPLGTTATGEHGFLLTWSVTEDAAPKQPVFDVGTYTVSAP